MQLAAASDDDRHPRLQAVTANQCLIAIDLLKLHRLPPRAVREALQRAGIGLEFMDTPAACRLYNILTAEGRKLAAALIAV